MRRHSLTRFADPPAYLHPSLCFIWLELALVFGVMVPLLLPLLSLQLALDAHIYEAALRFWNDAQAAGGVVKPEPRKPLLRWTIGCHAVLVLTLQVAFTTLFFVDSGIGEGLEERDFGPTKLMLVALPSIAVFGWCWWCRAFCASSYRGWCASSHPCARPGLTEGEAEGALA